MKRVRTTLLDTVESRMFASRGVMLNFSFMAKSTGVNSRAISCWDLHMDIRIPIIMLITMFQFSCPKCTAKPFFGPRSLWYRRTRRSDAPACCTCGFGLTSLKESNCSDPSVATGWVRLASASSNMHEPETPASMAASSHCAHHSKIPSSSALTSSSATVESSEPASTNAAVPSPDFSQLLTRSSSSRVACEQTHIERNQLKRPEAAVAGMEAAFASVASSTAFSKRTRRPRRSSIWAARTGRSSDATNGRRARIFASSLAFNTRGIPALGLSPIHFRKPSLFFAAALYDSSVIAISCFDPIGEASSKNNACASCVEGDPLLPTKDAFMMPQALTSRWKSSREIQDAPRRPAIISKLSVSFSSSVPRSITASELANSEKSSWPSWLVSKTWNILFGRNASSVSPNTPKACLNWSHKSTPVGARRRNRA
mmetsp:Transcript_3657/g.9311  ORF Transcript_3657/g.9311 Transcript_3657/m.9311 type:complete len:428 (-) Transcript_3657:278-1561(-)